MSPRSAHITNGVGEDHMSKAARKTEAPFALEGKEWKSLKDAQTDLLKSFRRAMRQEYPTPYRLTCKWLTAEQPVQADKPFRNDESRLVTSCNIWDRRGKKPVQIYGQLSCVAILPTKS
jgi:hypothetical protein